MPAQPRPSAAPNPTPAASVELGERVKELRCLYEVAAVFAERRGSLRECLERVVSVLPAACRFPERAAACLRLDGVEVGPPPDRDGSRSERITAALRVAGRQRGEVSIAYSPEPTPAPRASKPEARATATPYDNSRFLDEERELLEAVARQIGVFVASVEAEQRRADIEATLRHADRLATIGQLAAGVAHELNDPLSNVLGFAQLALKAPDLPGQVRADLARIVDAALRGREIIRKLLVFARQTPASKQPTAINAVIEEAMFLLEAGCENPGIRFVRELGAALPDIDADPVQVRQVVTNLVINAMQSIRGAGTVTVTTAAEASGGGADMAVVLTVADTGSGMTPEVRLRVFDPFFTTKDVGQGTGLGLAVVQGIVAGHGGSIEVESEPGRGSVFRVCLPVHAPAPGAIR